MTTLTPAHLVKHGTIVEITKDVFEATIGKVTRTFDSAQAAISFLEAEVEKQHQRESLNHAPRRPKL